ncbi:hypothetical protein [Roseovarius sp. MMSF_3359]|nr:hypothetical protein [Roseovarius sp. MMSF_3359]
MDLTSIESIMGLASGALGVTDKAASTANKLKTLFASGDKVDKDQASALLNDLASQLTAVNLMNVELSDAIVSLRKELRRIDEFHEQKERYELFETAVGDLVFKLKEEFAEGQPIHFICPVCLNQDGKFSFVTGSGPNKHCQSNTTHNFRFERSTGSRLQGRAIY